MGTTGYCCLCGTALLGQPQVLRQRVAGVLGIEDIEARLVPDGADATDHDGARTHLEARIAVERRCRLQGVHVARDIREGVAVSLEIQGVAVVSVVDDREASGPTAGKTGWQGCR